MARAKKNAKANKPQLWRGHRLIVRETEGRGGKGGRHYEVLIDSLPPALQEAWRANAAAEPDAPAGTLEYDPFPEITKARKAVIESALSYPKGSSERRREIEALAGEDWPWPTGETRRISESTIGNWISRYERDGLAGLRKSGRADKGKKRYFVSSAWHRKIDLDDDAKAQVEVKLKSHGQGVCNNAMAFAGKRKIADHLGNVLFNLTRDAGSELDSVQLRAICRLPREYVDQFEAHLLVGLHDRDRKRFNDKYVPSVRRSADGLVPMQRVQCDVTPPDVYYLSDDGSIRTCRLVAAMDVATRRVFPYLVFPEKGEGVRQEHIVEAFIEMATHAAWGMPGSLVIDNGSEYGCLDLIDDALKLSLPFFVEDEKKQFRHASGITKTIPFHATGKAAMEGFFGNFRYQLSMTPGYVGGDRTNKKIENLGRAPTPFPGTKKELAEHIFRLVHLYNDTPQCNGDLNGQSPNGALRAAIENGQKRADVSRETLYGAFCERKIYKVNRFGIEVKNRKLTYWHDDFARMVGDEVMIGIPKIVGNERIVVFGGDGIDIRCVAELDDRHASDDRARAIQKAHRRKLTSRFIAEHRSQGDKVTYQDIVAIDLAHTQPEPAMEIGATISLTGGTEAAGKALTETPKERRAREQEQARKREEREKAFQESVRLLSEQRQRENPLAYRDKTPEPGQAEHFRTIGRQRAG